MHNDDGHDCRPTKLQISPNVDGRSINFNKIIIKVNFCLWCSSPTKKKREKETVARAVQIIYLMTKLVLCLFSSLPTHHNHTQLGSSSFATVWRSVRVPIQIDRQINLHCRRHRRHRTLRFTAIGAASVATMNADDSNVGKI